MKILIIIPAYNEQANIGSVIKDLKQNCPQHDILVINDGSTDNTSVLTKKAVIRTIDLPINLGIGGAVQTGFIYADSHNYDIAVQFDGDGQHKASQISVLIAPISDNTADVTIGSRFLGKKIGFRSTFIRRLGIKFFKILNSILIGQKITDNTSGFRAYNRKAIKMLAENYPSDFPEPEAVILLGKNGFKIKEIFTAMDERIGGTSSIHGIKSIYYMIKVSIAILITSIKPKITV